MDCLIEQVCRVHSTAPQKPLPLPAVSCKPNRLLSWLSVGCVCPLLRPSWGRNGRNKKRQKLALCPVGRRNRCLSFWQSALIALDDEREDYGRSCLRWWVCLFLFGRMSICAPLQVVPLVGLVSSKADMADDAETLPALERRRDMMVYAEDLM